MIRRFQDEDLTFVESHDFLASLMIKYHGDVHRENIFTLIDEEKNIKGVLVLKYHYTWYSKDEEVNRVEMNIITDNDDEISFKELLNQATEWCHKQKLKYKDKNPSLVAWIRDKEYGEIEKYLTCGFYQKGIFSCMKFDLSKEIADYSIDKKYIIEELTFNKESITNYIEASACADEKGTRFSINEVLFSTGDPSYKIYVVKHGDKIVSSASMWRFDDDNAAVEFIYTLPSYRKQNLASAVITHILKEEKKQGYKIGTLGIFGHNKNAMKLYPSLGFNLYYNLVELIY